MREKESLFHLIRDCSWAVNFWNLPGIEAPCSLSNSFRDMLDWYLIHKGRNEAEKFATLCWQIWKSRNEEIFDRVVMPPLLNVRRALDWLLDYQCALMFDRGPSGNGRLLAAWSCPPADAIKINFDGAAHKEEDKFGLGFIARDSMGSFILAGSKSVWHCGSVEEAKGPCHVLDFFCC